MASPSWEVPTLEAKWAWYAPANWATPAIAMPSGVIPASTATTVPRRVASTGRSWNQIPSSVLGARTLGGSVASPCGASSARSPWCSRRCIFKAGWSSAGSVLTVWSEQYGGALYGCPGHLCVTHTAGYLKLGHRGQRYGNPWPRRHRSSRRDQGGGRCLRPLPVGCCRRSTQLDDGGRNHPCAPETIQGHMLVVFPQPGV